MEVKIRLKNIAFNPPAPAGWPHHHLAQALVEISYGGRVPIEMGFSVEGYQDLSDVADQLRKQVEEFANSLLVATTKPLLGAVPLSEPPEEDIAF